MRVNLGTSDKCHNGVTKTSNVLFWYLPWVLKKIKFG